MSKRMSDLVLLAKALADATRVRLLTLVSSRGAVCCGDLAKALDVSQATVTHHLRVLSSAKLIETRRDGQFIRVRACRPGIEACRAALNSLLPEAQPPAEDKASSDPSSRVERRGRDNHSSPAVGQAPATGGAP
jgi:ArsR family transcriptional regulator